MEEQKKSKKNVKKKLVGAAAGAVTAVSLLTGSLFDSADDILHIENEEETAAETAVVSVGKTPAVKNDRPGESAVTLRQRFRQFFLGQSQAVRALVVTPLWAVGHGLILLLSSLMTALAPVWQGLAAFLLQALLLAGIFLLLYKLIFPNRKLTDLLKKKNWLYLLLGSAALAGTDFALRTFVPEYHWIGVGIRVALAVLVLGLLCYRIFGPRKRPAALQPGVA